MTKNTTNYRAYATNMDHIKNSLTDDYVYKEDSFPVAEKQENASQKSMRENMVLDWAESMDPQVYRWDEWSHYQRAILLSNLFYSIWALRQATRIELASDSTSSKSFGNIDAHAILIEALPNVRKLHYKRCGRFIDESPDLVGTLFKMIRPGALEVIGKPQIARQDLLSLGGGLDRQEPAIYLHILWHKDMSTYEFYLYVGQAVVFVLRFDDHMNPLWRIKHPCLHYYVWDARDDMEEAFILLAVPEIEGLDQDGLTLNLLEFWSSLIFQSLGAQEIGKFVSMRIIQSGHQLNAAHPLWQEFKGGVGRDEVGSYEKEVFQKLIRDASPATRAYFLSLAQAFRDMKDSSNPALQQYCLSARQRGQLTSAGERSRKTAGELLAGVEKPVRHFVRSQQLGFGHVDVIIWKSLIILAQDSTVHVQGYLGEEAVPNCYAKNAGPSEPANRLSIRITGKDSAGRPFAIFVHTTRAVAVQGINTLVDALDGKSDDEIAQLPNRLIPPCAIKGRGQRIYS